MSVVYQEPASDIDLRHDGDPQPGEKVLQDIKERRTQEKQLLEIQRQLDLLGQDQEMTVSWQPPCFLTHSQHKNALYQHATCVSH